MGWLLEEVDELCGVEGPAQLAAPIVTQYGNQPSVLRKKFIVIRNVDVRPVQIFKPGSNLSEQASSLVAEVTALCAVEYQASFC